MSTWPCVQNDTVRRGLLESAHVRPLSFQCPAARSLPSTASEPATWRQGPGVRPRLFGGPFLQNISSQVRELCAAGLQVNYFTQMGEATRQCWRGPTFPLLPDHRQLATSLVGSQEIRYCYSYYCWVPMYYDSGNHCVAALDELRNKESRSCGTPKNA